MKKLLWFGIFFISISWLFFIPLFTASNYLLGFFILGIGIISNIISLWNIEKIKIHKVYLLLFIPVILSFFIIDFPFYLGPLILTFGIIVSVETKYLSKYNKIKKFFPGLLFSGILFTFQSSIFPLYTIFASRNHGTNFFSPLISFTGNILGLKTNIIDDTVYLGTTRNIFPFILSWESLGLFILINLFIGLICLLIFQKNRKKNIIYILLFIVISIGYIVLRYISIIAIISELSATNIDIMTILEIFYTPQFFLVSFLPLIFILMKIIPLKNVEMNFNVFERFSINKKVLVTSFLIFIFIFSLVGSYAYQDPGIEKDGKVLIDEYHSNWEDSVRPLDKEWYGRLSTYNLYSLTEWLNYYYHVDRNTNFTLTLDLLQNYDILILKCPTKPYSNEEVDAIFRFVENGGGLFLIGDHTNVFGMSTYLNQVAQRFGIEYKNDATFMVSTWGNFVEYSSPTMLPHPIVQHFSQFQFLTSCSLNAPLNSEDVMVSHEMYAIPGSYTTDAFFAEEGRPSIQPRGVFLISTALKYGKGRIVAFTDSTVFSSYCVFMDSHHTYALGVLGYLNKENVYQYFNILFFVIACVSGVLILFLLRKEEKMKSICLVIVVSLLFLSVAIVSFERLNLSSYPLPKPQKDIEKAISFDLQHSKVGISSVSLLGDEQMIEKLQKNSFSTFFLWTQRVGCHPLLYNNFNSALTNCDLLVIINPEIGFTNQEITLITDYVKSGGKVLLMDSIYNINSTANQLLSFFDIHITTEEEPYSVNIANIYNNYSFQPERTLSVGATTTVPHIVIDGGKPILSDSNGHVILSIKNYGTGALAVFVDSSTFSEWKMGGAFTIPDEEQNEIYNLEYYIIENLLFNENDVTPSSIDGNISFENQYNKFYSTIEEKTYTAITITYAKVDMFIGEFDPQGKFSAIQTTSFDETGHYKITNMIPGYYKISVTIDNITIHESYSYIPSGNTTYNVSIAKPSKISGFVYYDNNANNRYDQTEELDEVNLSLYYQTITGKYKLIEILQTDESGRYSFSSLLPGYYIINASVINRTSGNIVYNSSKQIIFNESEVLELNISMNMLQVTVQGHIIIGNETVQGFITFVANQSIVNNTATKIKIALANTTGYYSILLYPGFYKLSINQSYEQNETKYTYFYFGNLEVQPGEGVKTFDIYLIKKD
ncbi:MAG: hypothetical protein NT038_10900 [Euryarchaeota archaeon]|nr:hypothetical protein [Euryarchaeota archaeon]